MAETKSTGKEQKKTPRQTYTGRRSVKDPAPDAGVLIANTMQAAKKKEAPLLGQRVKFYREKLGMEQKALAQQLNIGANSISNWECGRARPDIALLPKICLALGITADELLGMDVLRAEKSNDSESETSKPQMTVTSSQPTVKKSGMEMIKRYYQLSITHQFVVDGLIEKLLESEDMEIYNQVVEVIAFDKRLSAGFDPGVEFDDKGEITYLKSKATNSQTDCIFTVSGNSMEPEFHNGDKVMVQRYPQCGKLQSGDIGAFITGNETYIKEYQPDGLHSLNPDYETMIFQDDDSVYLIGKVLGIVSDEAELTYEETVRYEEAKKRIEERMNEE